MRHRPDAWIAPDVYDWQTGGRQLSEEERKIARRLAPSHAASFKESSSEEKAEALERGGE